MRTWLWLPELAFLSEQGSVVTCWEDPPLSAMFAGYALTLLTEKFLTQLAALRALPLPINIFCFCQNKLNNHHHLSLKPQLHEFAI